MDELLKELLAELKNAKHTEQHLHSAENALIQKDKEIAEMKKSYNALVEHNAMLHKSLDNRNARIAKLSKDLEKANSAIESTVHDLDIFIAENHNLRMQIDSLADRIAELENPEALQLKLDNAQLQEDKAGLQEELKKYKGALKDLEGALFARSDHDKELADLVHKLLNNG